MPARPAKAEVPIAPLSMEIEEPVPSFDSFDEGPALSFDLDASEPLDLDLDTGFEPPPPPPPPPARTPTLTRLQSAVEMAAADLDSEDAAGEDLDFVTEHLTEAEVFAKYGLTEKATEHLRAIIERADAASADAAHNSRCWQNPPVVDARRRVLATACDGVLRRLLRRRHRDRDAAGKGRHVIGRKHSG